MPFWSIKKDEKHTFSDLVRGLQHAVNAAMEMAEVRNLELLSRYFTEDGTPLVRRLIIDEHTSMDVPVISIVSPTAINIKEVEMEFGVQINNVEVLEKLPQRGFLVNGQSENLQISMERSNLEIRFGSDPNQTSTMKVKIKFEAGEPSEGIARVVEEFGKGVVPVDRETK